MKKIVWGVWLLATLGLAGYYGWVLLQADDKSELLIGEATHGHFQIELACSSCHTQAFGGGEVLQDACVSCHGDDLAMAHDSHPRKKFTDPRNADLLQILDARQCVSCHTEHQNEQTHPMGVTVPEDYCFHCHEDIGERRPSHANLPFDSCASAGCHNFHDNRALYEDFLVSNAGGPWVRSVAQLAERNAASLTALPKLPVPVFDEAELMREHPQVAAEFLASSHAAAGVGCSGCHTGADQQWLPRPELNQCKTCHVGEVETWLQGKHGMRLAQGLSAMSPSMGRLEFHQQSENGHQGCTSCHGAHKFDAKRAAVGGCLDCHADQHSLAFTESPHGLLTQQALNNERPWSEAVTCATCHMPRLVNGDTGIKVDKESVSALGESAVVSVTHNQNLTLRPNEKMIRPVCMSCHSLEFSIDALADESLIQNNFKGKPHQHIESIDWAVKRDQR